MHTKYMNNGKLTAQGAERLGYAVRYGVENSEATEDDLTACYNGVKQPIRTRNMGWGR